MVLTMKKQGQQNLLFFISKSVPALFDSGNSSSIGESGRLEMEVTSITVVFVLKR